MGAGSTSILRFTLGLAALGGAAACNRSEARAEPAGAPKEEPPIHVATAAVTERTMPEFLTLTGTLRANQESEIAADANGKVLATFVERGQTVKKGDLLATLDARTAALMASAMTAQTNLAKAQVEQAQKDCERARHLLDTGAISRAEYDRTSTACSTTRFSAAAAAAQQASAVKVAGDANIKAPFAGVIGERYVSVGQYVQPQTRVASIYDPDPLRLELTVPEANIAAVRPEMPVTFHVTSFGDQAFTGTVKFISPNVRQSSRDLVVEALVPNGDRKLKPGMFATAQLDVADHAATVVPSSAVQREGATARVFVVADGRVQERVVQTGAEIDGVTAVQAGVKVGDKVVTTPAANVHDGARVD
jgi:membrane fusion protein (multidrug efflux system)